MLHSKKVDDKLEKVIIDGKITLVDDESKPLKNVDYPDDRDSEDEVASIDNEITSFMASERVGYGFSCLTMKSGFLDSVGRGGGRTKEKMKETNVSNSGCNSTDLKGGKDNRLGSFPSLSEAFGSPSPTSLASNIDDVGGTSNDANKGTQVDNSREKTNDNTLILFVVLISVDRNKTQSNFCGLTTSASSECGVVIPRSYVEKLTHALIWVNLLDVQLMAFSIDGLSTIVNKIGKPLMLDSFTSMMCNESWEQNSYARTMIEIFGHDSEHCPKMVPTKHANRGEMHSGGTKGNQGENGGTCMRVETDVAEGQNDDVDEGHKSGGGIERKSLYERWEDDYDDNPKKGPVSYAKLLNGEPSLKSFNFRTLLASARNGADVAISLESVRVVHKRLSDTVYGFVLGKRVAYLVVEKYVKNTWSKCGVVKSMMTTKDVPVWSSSGGHMVEKVIESENNKGTLDKNVGQTPISSTVDPNLVGNRTNVVVPLESIRAISDWSSYARAMIELRADVELKNTIMVAIPKLVGGGILYDECPKNIGLSVAKNLKNPRQAPRGVSVSHKMWSLDQSIGSLGCDLQEALSWNNIRDVNLVYAGAKADGRLDTKNAFLKAWNMACASTTPATIYVPRDGTLVAPSGYNAIGKDDVWIKFHRVNHLTISGGTLDAQGGSLWACKLSGKTCPKGAT
ncbi:putative polygalacturonase, partial [Tanacetum coccineum]